MHKDGYVYTTIRDGTDLDKVEGFKRRKLLFKFFSTLAFKY